MPDAIRDLTGGAGVEQFSTARCREQIDNKEENVKILVSPREVRAGGTS